MAVLSGLDDFDEEWEIVCAVGAFRESADGGAEGDTKSFSEKRER